MLKHRRSVCQNKSNLVGSLVVSADAKPGGKMSQLMPPIDGMSSDRLDIIWGSRLPLYGSDELQVGVLFLGPLLVLGGVVPGC